MHSHAELPPGTANSPGNGMLPEKAVGDLSHGQDGATVDGLDLDQLLHALQAMRVGDFSVRLPGNLTGRAGKVADTFNEIVTANERMAKQLEHVGQVVGREGKTRTRVRFGLTMGAWSEMEISVNTLICFGRRRR
jgi:hypothetical protein